MRLLPALLLVLSTTASAVAQDALSPELRGKIDAAVADVLARTGAPSASIAVVQDGALAYARAYGSANLETRVPATPLMRYSIGSISKQFTAAALLLLAEQQRLSLDDRLVRYLPELTRAQDVSLRQLLSMTSGYQDFWPQDYVMPGMLQPVTPQQILERWGRIPLDFEPGSRWQYSNTNYVIAGLVVGKVAGTPLLDFLRKQVFEPLHMTSVVDTDEAGLGPEDPVRYMRYGLGPLRVAPKEGRGWMFAAGELAMTAADLARWDVSLIDQSLLKPESYRALESEVRLENGVGTGYGLGVGVSLSDGRRLIAHGGEVSGFTARNAVYPDDKAAVVVLTNLDATDASTQAAQKIASLLFAGTGSGPALEQARRIFTQLQEGRIDRSLLTANASAYFSEQALRDFAASLGPLGTPKEFSAAGQSSRGGMTLRRYTVALAKHTLRITTFTMPDGKLEQYMVASQ
jgi:CubicO group peptidase (beta-lactamase class C family)